MIKAIALDVDGVLTDGTFWWDARGEELKRFSFRDIMGIARALARGCPLRARSPARDSPLVDRYAAKMGITDVCKGCKDKAARCASSPRIAASPSKNRFMGDDVNDLAALDIAGFSAAPADAHESVRAIVKLVTRHPGGNGAVREMLDFLNLGK